MVETNRERIPYNKWQQMHIFIDDPTLKPQDAAESNLKHRALKEFHLIQNKLYRNCDIAHKQPRYVVPLSEVLDLIIINIISNTPNSKPHRFTRER